MPNKKSKNKKNIVLQVHNGTIGHKSEVKNG